MHVRRAALLASSLAALALGGVAAADTQPVRYTAADQAAARAAVLRKADLGAPGWTGGPRKPELSPLPCSGFHPKQSDLVLTGAAQSVFSHSSGLVLASAAQVLRSATMVRLDWQRTVASPQLLPCLRSVFARQAAAAGQRLVSVRRLPFPAVVGSSTAAYRALMEMQVLGATASVAVDLVLVGRSRTELTLSAAAPYARRAELEAAERRVARLLASRVRA